MKNNSISIRALAKVCEKVNRISTKNLPSYKKASSLISSMGFICNDVEYVNSYLVDSEYIDIFSYLQGRILIYSTNESIVGCKVENAPYIYKKFLETELKGFKALETKEYIVYEKVN